MENLLDLSSRIIDSGNTDNPVPVNRVRNEISELADGLAIVESFSHCVTWDSGDGLVCFDASGSFSGEAVVGQIRTWRNSPITHLVYTHGHADHVGGSPAFAADAANRGNRAPHVVGHENVRNRLDRYRLTNNWNVLVNARQFGGIRPGTGVDIGYTKERFIPDDVLPPDTTFEADHLLTIGNETIELHHDRGETDDHLWGWMPRRKWLFTGDFVIWNFPNAGNPQKVQRYPLEWAAALRKMIAVGPELLLPAHGLPIEGRARIANVLDDIATALEDLVREVLGMMNSGATLDAIVHGVRVPETTLAKPYLRPFYDEPEFVIRNIWRQFGGWWDGAASRLKPAPDPALGAEVAALAGGAMRLAQRAVELANAGDLRLACHLADLAGWAAPDDPEVHEIRAEVYLRRRKAETSLMSKGIFSDAARRSQAVVERATGDTPSG